MYSFYKITGACWKKLMNDYVGDTHSKGTEADPHCNSGRVCRDNLCIRFPPEWMNNKSFILLSGGDNSGRYTEAIKVVGASQRMHIWLVSNIQRTGGGGLCNLASYCDALGRGWPSAQSPQHQDQFNAWCTVRIDMKRRHWPFLWHGEPVLVLLALLSVLLHGGTGVGNKSLLHGLSNPQAEELVGAGLLSLHGPCTQNRKCHFSLWKLQTCFSV